jgi:hypothetical protein
VGGRRGRWRRGRRSGCGGGADGGRDLLGVAGNRLLDGGPGQTAPVDLAEEPVQAEGLVGVEDLLDELVAGADHDGVAALGAGVELDLVDHEPASTRGLGTQVLVVVGEALACRLGGGGGVEVGGDPDLELLGVAGEVAGVAVELDRAAWVVERATDVAEHHGQAEAAGAYGASG